MLSAFSTCNPSSGLCEEIVKEEVHHAVGENIAKLTEQGPWMLNHAWLIFVIPAISYFLILFFGKRLPKKGHEIGLVSMAAVSTMAIVLAFQWITRSEEFEGKVFGQTFTWWRNGDLKYTR